MSPRLVSVVVCAAASCGGPQSVRDELPPVDCQYVTLPPRFCGPAEDETLFLESHREPVQVCNGCFADEDCVESPGGRCVELPGQGCAYSAFVCVYPGSPCAEGGSCPEGGCVNVDGRATCHSDGTSPPP